MRLAYADPPYLGLAAKFYGHLHPEAHVYDTIEAHAELLAKLATYDGWLYCLQAPALPQILPHVVGDYRIGAWMKPFAAWRPNQRIQYTWEPVLFKSARPKPESKETPSVRDCLMANIAMRKGLRGAKPDAFNRWVLELLGYKDGDEVDDLFPGTNGMRHAMNQLVLT